ncbi:T9SS C-terminal target domain-containing protein [Chitinophaga silvatica]|uniref:T9SS C-terminal target domain-containing protein n=1 Tax=Chitinophaga silvatica TaxID=2282649 RepID=A0A3E1YE83_9BACT|nr:T9SS C-terminal target domain-containing protein [Chitinophaga silvatica]
MGLSAQQGVYIPAGDTVWLSTNTNVGIFGDMTNNGILGSQPNSTFYFLSKLWTNGNAATLPDESTDGLSGTGGVFVFSGTGQQRVFGGYSLIAKTGASFPNLQINNISGLWLDDFSDLKIRNNLHFANGSVYLNGWNMMVGNNTPGSITGYNDKRFVVTGPLPAGGLLYRAAINNAAGKVVFPVGTDDNSYSPAAVLMTGGKDDFGVRTYDSVYTIAAAGTAYKDSFVNKSWNIQRINNNGGEVDVILQHMESSELPTYAANRDSSYITQFVGGVWDRLLTIPNKPLPGTLTESSMSEAAVMHLRHFTSLGASEYMAKTILVSNAKPAMFLSFEAYRISPVIAQLDWTTSREVNNLRFEVERRYEREETFTKIASIPTKAVNGNSSVPIRYTYQDLNDYDDWTYYRIKAIGKNGQVVYSEIRAVPPFIQVNVYPNPNNGNFKVTIHGMRGDMIIQIRDTWSQVVRSYEAKSGDTDIKITDLPSGAYFLVLFQKETMKVAYTCKVIVAQ